MNHFKVRRIEDAPSIPCAHEDLGLCFVSKFTVGLQTIYSVSRQEDNPVNAASIRVEKAKEDLLEHGYSWNGVL